MIELLLAVALAFVAAWWIRRLYAAPAERDRYGEPRIIIDGGYPEPHTPLPTVGRWYPIPSTMEPDEIAMRGLDPRWVWATEIIDRHRELGLIGTNLRAVPCKPIVLTVEVL